MNTDHNQQCVTILIKSSKTIECSTVHTKIYKTTIIEKTVTFQQKLCFKLTKSFLNGLERILEKHVVFNGAFISIVGFI